MKHIKLFEEFITEGAGNPPAARSGEVLKPKRNNPMVFDAGKHPELANEFFDLIKTAYAELGGHVKVQSPADVFSDPDWNFWEGIDIHGTNDFDLIMFGQKTKYGIKFSGVGHDGTSDAKRTYIAERGKDLHKLGYFVEVSGKIADILITSYKVPIVDDPKEVEKVLGKPVEWLGKSTDPKMPGDGWYARVLGGGKHEKIMLGKPKV